MSLAVGAIVDGCPCQTLQQNKNNKARCSAVGQKVRPHSVGLSQCSSSEARLASSTCKTNPPVGKQGQFSSAVWTIGMCRQHAAVMFCSILVWPSSSCQELSSGNTSKAGKQSTRLTLTPPCQSILCQRFAYVDKAQACATRNLSPSCTNKLSITQYTLHQAWAMQNSSEFVLWSYDHFKTLIYFHALSMWKEGSKHGLLCSISFCRTSFHSMLWECFHQVVAKAVLSLGHWPVNTKKLKCKLPALYLHNGSQRGVHDHIVFGNYEMNTIRTIYRYSRTWHAIQIPIL